jgi:hypothetical protein
LRKWQLLNVRVSHEVSEGNGRRPKGLPEAGSVGVRSIVGHIENLTIRQNLMTQHVIRFAEVHEIQLHGKNLDDQVREEQCLDTDNVAPGDIVGDRQCRAGREGGSELNRVWCSKTVARAQSRRI